MAEPKAKAEKGQGAGFRSRRAEEAGNKKASHPAAGRPRPGGVATSIGSFEGRRAEDVPDPPGAQSHQVQEAALPPDMKMPKDLSNPPPEVLSFKGPVDEVASHYESQPGARFKVDPESQDKTVLIPVKSGHLVVRIVRVQDRTVVVRQVLSPARP